MGGGISYKNIALNKIPDLQSLSLDCTDIGRLFFHESSLKSLSLNSCYSMWGSCFPFKCNLSKHPYLQKLSIKGDNELEVRLDSRDLKHCPELVELSLNIESFNIKGSTEQISSVLKIRLSNCQKKYQEQNLKNEWGIIFPKADIEIK